MMRPSLALITALLCLSPLAPPAKAATAPRAPRLDFELQIAERRALTARSPEAFAEAADALGSAIAHGHRNRVTLYNHGTLLLLGKRYVEAEATLEAAECISGTTWGIRRNLRLARSEGHKERLQPLAWQRIPLFWHFQLSLGTRLTVAAAASLLCWIALTLLLTRHRRLGRYLLAIGVATIVCFGTSVVSSLSRSRPVPIAEEAP